MLGSRRFLHSEASFLYLPECVLFTILGMLMIFHLLDDFYIQCCILLIVVIAVLFVFDIVYEDFKLNEK